MATNAHISLGSSECKSYRVQTVGVEDEVAVGSQHEVAGFVPCIVNLTQVKNNSFRGDVTQHS
jgi:hypothetical protein